MFPGVFVFILGLVKSEENKFCETFASDYLSSIYTNPQNIDIQLDMFPTKTYPLENSPFLLQVTSIRKNWWVAIELLNKNEESIACITLKNVFNLTKASNIMTVLYDSQSCQDIKLGNCEVFNFYESTDIQNEFILERKEKVLTIKRLSSKISNYFSSAINLDYNKNIDRIRLYNGRKSIAILTNLYVLNNCPIYTCKNSTFNYEFGKIFYLKQINWKPIEISFMMNQCMSRYKSSFTLNSTNYSLRTSWKQLSLEIIDSDPVNEDYYNILIKAGDIKYKLNLDCMFKVRYDDTLLLTINNAFVSKDCNPKLDIHSEL